MGLNAALIKAVGIIPDFMDLDLKLSDKKTHTDFSPDLLHWEGMRPSSSEQDQSHVLKYLLTLFY